jgi:hypothetical protein
MIFPRMVVLQDAFLFARRTRIGTADLARLWAETAVRGKAFGDRG